AGRAAAAGDRGLAPVGDARRLRPGAGGDRRSDRRRRSARPGPGLLSAVRAVTTPLAVYRPGDSLLHRAPVWIKLVALVAVIVAISLLVRVPWQLAPPAVLLVAAAVAARRPIGARVRRLLPVLAMLAVIGVFQWVLSGWRQAVVVCGVLLLSVLAAALVTVTTPISALLDTVVAAAGPLRRIGVDPERVGLVFALTLRAVPLLAELLGQVTEARQARGLRSGVRATEATGRVGALARPGARAADS